MIDRDRVERLRHFVSGLAEQCRKWSEINGNWAEPGRSASDAAHLVEAIRLAAERDDNDAVRHLADMADEKLVAATQAIRRLDPATADSLRAERRLLEELRECRQQAETERDISGYARVVAVIGDEELAWVFLTEEQPFENEAARPLDKLKRGEIEEVVGAALSFGSAPT
jgi:hypothetical protein